MKIFQPIISVLVVLFLLAGTARGGKGAGIRQSDYR